MTQQASADGGAAQPAPYLEGALQDLLAAAADFGTLPHPLEEYNRCARRVRDAAAGLVDAASGTQTLLRERVDEQIRGARHVNNGVVADQRRQGVVEGMRDEGIEAAGRVAQLGREVGALIGPWCEVDWTDGPGDEFQMSRLTTALRSIGTGLEVARREGWASVADVTRRTVAPDPTVLTIDAGRRETAEALSALADASPSAMWAGSYDGSDLLTGAEFAGPAPRSAGWTPVDRWSITPAGLATTAAIVLRPDGARTTIQVDGRVANAAAFVGAVQQTLRVLAAGGLG